MSGAVRKATIYVDQVGTLFQLEPDTHRYVPNSGLIEALEEAAAAGHRIVFHTSGHDRDHWSERIRTEIAAPRLLQFLPVVSKDDARGRTLDIVIDDVSSYRLELEHGFRSGVFIPAEEPAFEPKNEAAYFRKKLTAAFDRLNARANGAPPAPKLRLVR